MLVLRPLETPWEAICGEISNRVSRAASYMITGRLDISV
jgi:hypothetical protein